MKTRDLIELGVPRGEPVDVARKACIQAAQSGMKKRVLADFVAGVAAHPERYTDDAHFGELARLIVQHRDAKGSFAPRETGAPYRQWGRDLDEKSVQQMHRACELPVAVQGALMPDAHVGYGLPIGGVLATQGAVIPYAVGVDIACRVKLTVLDLPVHSLERRSDILRDAIESETRFGVGAEFKHRRTHDVLDADWSVSPITRRNKDKAWAQLGSSGSGNHFVEFGVFTVEHDALGVAPGQYLALLSHSGSRGTGASVCDYYSKVAMDKHRELPDEMRHLSWLDLDSAAGREYWEAMELMGRYASANHEMIHKHIRKRLGAEVLLDVENHHNFAWKERHHGREVVVHRKGATPAGEGVLGVIPGSMASPGFVVRGRGNPMSLNSAAHGAGRVMSRTQAKKTFTWKMAKDWLDREGVTLISAGLDEVPMVYKNIHEVMAAQQDLVEVLAQFDPKLVKMAAAGERPED
jgi:tRNA-splicing ligase RtcB